MNPHQDPWRVRINGPATQEYEGPIAGDTGACDGGSRRPFCLGTFGSGSHAVAGFLGKWAAEVEKRDLSKEWHAVSNASHRVVEEILGKSSDHYEWKKLLMCIVSGALGLRRVKADLPSGEVEIWEQANWQLALNKGIQSPWNQQAAGQGALVALTCLIRALLGNRRGGPEVSQGTEELCQNLWSLVKINTRQPDQGETTKDIKSLGQFLNLLPENPEGGSLRYGSLGLLLSIYYGMNKCCKREAPFELTGLVDKGSWELGGMGACTINQDVLSCSGDYSQRDQNRLTIWKAGSSVLFSKTPQKIGDQELIQLEEVSPESEGDFMRPVKVSPKTDQSGSQSSSKPDVGGMIGGLVGVILAVASVYGISRVYFGRSRRNSRRGIAGRDSEVYIRYEKSQGAYPPEGRTPPNKVEIE
ncbi:hypothetical protein C922_01744 [Plasmodium inui San Antonio 1]|uniref:Uncharacterized protein n=1 Tax=Plasmodium inui San Antonio 1 TaxID=1237626 RepID=W7AET4_9APIC|nr:hypothetical protein C922_01744 [Plasmodium inui San Antonio 1]EUD67559.1 hypothetical protein C922_01744 [Plasmodium inui San Antonio 1]